MKEHFIDIQSTSSNMNRRGFLATATFSLLAGASCSSVSHDTAKEGDRGLERSGLVDQESSRPRALLEARLKEITEAVVQDPLIPHALVLVDAPQLGKPVTAATGFSDPVKEVPVQPIDQFMTASISKMFTAATLMRLREKGLINLDETLAQYLPAQLLQGLSVYDGTGYASKITLRQCLQHTSGLVDYWADGPRDDRDLTPFDLELYSNRDKFWSLVDVIKWTKQNLNFAIGKPGTVYHYSDTNFVLLGILMERVTGKPLYSLVRELVLEPLNMEGTYARFREKERRPTGVNLSRNYDSRLRVEGTPPRGNDMTMEMHESADYAGGGWLSTAPDLVKFLRGVSGASGNGLFKNNESWKLMQETSELAIYKSSDSGLDYHYGLGLFIDDIGKGEGERLIGHFGYYGSFALLWPKGNVVMVGHYGQGNPSSEYKMRWGQFRVDVFKAVCEAVSQKPD